MIIINDDGRFWLGKRIGTEAWQFPQGGIDKGEKVVIINKGKIVESGDVIKIVKKTKQKNIRDAFNKLVGVKV